MSIIKNIAIKNSLKKIRQKSFIFLNEASLVIFFINNDFQKQIAIDISKKFNFKFDFVFFELKDNSTENFSKKDFNLFYKLKSEKLKKLLNLEYDVLINLTCEDNFYNYFISNIINAKFKIGASCYNKKYIDYDFTLQLINDKIDNDWKTALLNNLSEKRIL